MNSAPSPSAARIESDSISAILAVTAISLSLIATAPVTGILITALSIIATLLPVFRPDETWQPITDNLTKLIPDLINDALLKEAILQANIRRKIHLDKYQSILKTLQTWKSDGTNRLMLISQYNDLITNYVTEMHWFTPEKYRDVLLPQYAAVAYAHIPALSAFYPYANELGLDGRADGDAQSMVAAHLQRDIAIFINTAIDSFRLGLKKLIHNSENTSSDKQSTWDDYNLYRTKMLILSLDQITQLVYWNPLLYQSGCTLRFKNRSLYTFFDTYNDSNAAKKYRGKILEFENKHIRPRPIWKTHTLLLDSARLLPERQAYHLIDGLFSTEMLSYSIDGYNIGYSSGISGESVPGDPDDMVLRKTQPIPISDTCFCLHGSYWNGLIRAPGGNFWFDRNYTRTIRDMTVIADAGHNQNKYTYVRFYSDYGQTNVFSKYIQSLPVVSAIPSPMLPSNFTGRLAGFTIIVDPQYQVHSYLLTWYDISATQALLPAQNHADAPEITPAEQFHAIKAAASIQQQRLKIIPGPGFTGGDLVEIGAGKHLDFRFRRNATRWFNGRYRVRLWVVTPPHPATVIIRVIPEGNFAKSRTEAQIQASNGAPANLLELKHEDLAPVLLIGDLIISKNMEVLTLQLSNTSSAQEIIVDRIELIFTEVATATMDE